MLKRHIIFSVFKIGEGLGAYKCTNRLDVIHTEMALNPLLVSNLDTFDLSFHVKPGGTVRFNVSSPVHHLVSSQKNPDLISHKGILLGKHSNTQIFFDTNIINIVYVKQYCGL